MSTKTLRKRIALVAVSALGFGLVSVAPSQGANATSITNLTIAKSASVSDASLFVATNAGTSLARTVKIFTTNDTVLLSDLAYTVTGASVAATTFNAMVYSGAIAAGAKSAYLRLGTSGVVTGTNADAVTSTNAFASGAPTLVGTPTGITTTTLAATTAGSTYVCTSCCSSTNSSGN